MDLTKIRPQLTCKVTLTNAIVPYSQFSRSYVRIGQQTLPLNEFTVHAMTDDEVCISGSFMFEHIGRDGRALTIANTDTPTITCCRPELSIHCPLDMVADVINLFAPIFGSSVEESGATIGIVTFYGDEATTIHRFQEMYQLAVHTHLEELKNDESSDNPTE